MSTISLFFRGLLLTVLAGGMLGCAVKSALPGYLVTDTEVQWDVHGAWISLETRLPGGMKKVGGEFIAYEDSTVHVLTERGAVSVKIPDIRKAIVEVHSDKSGTITEWALLGVLASPAQGWFFVFTFPAWIITGVATATADSWSDQFVGREPPVGWWWSMSKFARFPQGLPRSVNPDSLRLNPRRQMTEDPKK